MATTYFVGKASQDANGAFFNQPKYIENGSISVVSQFTPATCVINDVYNVAKVPAGAVITDVSLDTADLDSGTAITLSVGDATTVNRFISASNVGQAGGIVRLSVQGGLGFVYTTDTLIQVKVIAAPTGFTAGLITVAITYTMTP